MLLLFHTSIIFSQKWRRYTFIFSSKDNNPTIFHNLTEIHNDFIHTHPCQSKSSARREHSKKESRRIYFSYAEPQPVLCKSRQERHEYVCPCLLANVGITGNYVIRAINRYISSQKFPHLVLLFLGFDHLFLMGLCIPVPKVRITEIHGPVAQKGINRMDTLPFLRPRPAAGHTERLRNVFLASQQKPMPFFTYKFTRLLTSET